MRITFLQPDSESDNGKLVLAESLQHCPKRLATSIYISKTTFRRDGSNIPPVLQKWKLQREMGGVRKSKSCECWHCLKPPIPLADWK